LKLNIGDYEIPERCLRYVVLYRAALVSFGGVLVGDEGLQIREKLHSLALMKAISFEAVDSNGVYATGWSDIKKLKFDPSTKPTTKFFGELVRPLEPDYDWDVNEATVRLHRMAPQMEPSGLAYPKWANDFLACLAAPFQRIQAKPGDNER